MPARLAARVAALIVLAALAFLVAANPRGATGLARPSLRADDGSPQSPRRLLAADGAGPAVLIGAGDICVTQNLDDARATARLISAEANAQVFTLGDNSNETGTATQYQDCYGRTWGEFIDRTFAAAGNHDYYADDGASYFAYFGAAAGPSGKGYYSYEAGEWHIVVLNSECDAVGGCDAGSLQERWLAADLASHSAFCTLAYWHQPRFSSGAPGQGSDSTYQAFWDDLYAFHADVVLNGHAHDYERFAPQTPQGEFSSSGIREFIVGTGGAGQLPFGTTEPNSELRQTGTLGVLRLELRSTTYTWHFARTSGEPFSDSGLGVCH